MAQAPGRAKRRSRQPVVPDLLLLIKQPFFAPWGRKILGRSAAANSVGRNVDRDSDGLERHREGPPALKIWLQANGLLTRPACIAGVLTSRPNFNARRGLRKV